MGNQHNTFPGEKPEMPVPKEIPEVHQPSEPRSPEVPKEDPQINLDELPTKENPPAGPRKKPGTK